mgnify:CR=1 FL=1
MKKRYIRFGEIPKNEQSSTYYHNEFIRYENGTSVYDAVYLNKLWKVVLPIKITIDTIPTYECLRMYQKRKVYLVTGTEVGIGKDGEPLIHNIHILKDLTNLYY